MRCTRIRHACDNIHIRAAAVALDVCRAQPRVAAARVTVAKAGAVANLGSAAVTLGARFA